MPHPTEEYQKCSDLVIDWVTSLSATVVTTVVRDASYLDVKH